VREAARRAIERIRETGEAYFLELTCYRFVGHGIGDDNTKGWMTYRNEDEVAEWRQRDPLEKLYLHLEERGFINLEQVDAIEHEVRAQVDDAIAFAESSPEPPLDSLYDHVYS
jgi:TPP-dependent pyruvate/acetoin dehydrogenase alpha subunit